MTNITVPIPPSLHRYRGALREFISGMVRKLDMNSHKDTPTRQRIPDIIQLLRVEVEEFEAELAKDAISESALIELMDASNFAFLTYVALRLDGVKTRREILIEEYFRIDSQLGKVYCKKTRAGAQYKVGEEIKGTNRDGYIDIRLQVRRDEFMSAALPRSHLIWWAHHGVWPLGVIDHQNRIRNDDRIINLRDLSFGENSLNHGHTRRWPNHVTQYLPTGRQHLIHYGKFVYQKQHNGCNVRCAYYDTPELAATQGALDWERKIANGATT